MGAGLDGAVPGEEDVERFEIAVDDAALVEVCCDIHDWDEESPYPPLREQLALLLSFLDQGGQIPALSILEDDIQDTSMLIPEVAVAANNVGMGQLFENLNLMQYIRIFS